MDFVGDVCCLGLFGRFSKNGGGLDNTYLFRVVDVDFSVP